MFGKNYDEEIKQLRETSNATIRSLNNIIRDYGEFKKIFSQMQDSIIELAKVQATHKESITFLLNHATVDENARDDFFKMLRNMKELNAMKKEAKR